MRSIAVLRARAIHPSRSVVSELADEIDGRRRLSRQPSWTRRDYVEEVYRCEVGGAGALTGPAPPRRARGR